jgi:hypothetical protein
MAIGPVKPTPKAKPKADMVNRAPKKPYAKSHQEYIGNPGLQAGKTAKAKAAVQKAIKGGAAKTAKKLAPRDALKENQITSVYTNSKLANGYGVKNLKPTKYTSEKQKTKRSMIASNIINDLSKTAMRAKIIEMNAVNKKAKKKGSK